MCGILGAKDISMFEVLFEANKIRGAFASSVCSLLDDGDGHVVDHWIGKFENIIDVDKLKMNKDEQSYVMGHFQAPTSSKRKWSYDTSHPFETTDWLCAHNGVITNFQYLNASYTPWNCNIVDTSVIISMIQQEYENTKRMSINKEYKILEKVLDRIEGTFGLFIVNTNNYNTYICRQGSTLFFDDKGNFSSVKGKNMKEVPEGKIFQLVDNYGSFKEVGKFTVKSPFLVV